MVSLLEWVTMMRCNRAKHLKSELKKEKLIMVIHIKNLIVEISNCALKQLSQFNLVGTVTAKFNECLLIKETSPSMGDSIVACTVVTGK